MTRKQSILFISFLFVFINVGVILSFRHLSESGSFFGQAPVKEEETFFVKRAVDGDTIELDNGEKVRYIGINTPESVDPRRSVECFGKEASEFNKNLVEGKSVALERDISDRDRYGRLLRFVYLEDGTFVNEILVWEGYASVMTYPPDVSKQDIFREAEQEARSEKRGLWSETTCNGKK
jgi:micrococcal nuclease